MLTEFEVKNFRCFEAIKLSDLRRINLIGGANNSGKTSLLEALLLFLARNNPTLTKYLNDMRGRGGLRTPLSMWGYLFHRAESSVPVEMAGSEGRGRNSLRISLEEASEAEVDVQAGTRHDQLPETLRYDFSSAGKTAVVRASIREEGPGAGRKLVVPTIPTVKLCRTTILTPHGTSGAAAADHFSELRKSDGGEAIRHLLQTLQILAPDLLGLEVLTDGQFKELYGQVGGHPHPLPLSLMGEGMVRVFGILSAIQRSSDGVTLIDEVENGLHHSIMPKVWAAIAKAARDANTQVFATTHSYECLQAAGTLLDEPDDPLRFYRLDRVGETIKVTLYEREILRTALSENIEVR